MKEVFQLMYSAHIRQKKTPEAYALIKIEATDRKALEKLFRDLIEQDKHGVLRDVIQKAMLTAVKHEN